MVWRGAGLASPVPVPEAAVDEYHGLVLRQHNIRPPRQLLSVKPEPIPHAVQQAPDHLFRCRVFAANARHVPGAASFGQAVFVHRLEFNSEGAKTRRFVG